MQNDNGVVGQLLRDSKEILKGLKGESRRVFLLKVMHLNNDEEAVLDDLFGGLSRIHEGLDGIGQVRFLSPLVALLDDYRKRRSSGFDFEQAERVRESKGVARKKLSVITNIHEMSIYKMEKGRLPFDHKKPKHQAYMKWLVDNGYKV